MMENKTFKTKTGYCHILPDKIALSRDGVIGEFSQAVNGEGMSKMLLLYAGFSIFFLYQANEEFKQDNMLFAFSYLSVGLFFAYTVWESRNLSATMEINRSVIEKVSFIKAVPYLTRSRFVVFFKGNNGKKLRRLIILPGSLSGGVEATERALQILKSENLL